jgi:hypothetical protein
MDINFKGVVLLDMDSSTCNLVMEKDEGPGIYNGQSSSLEIMSHSRPSIVGYYFMVLRKHLSLPRW